MTTEQSTLEEISEGLAAAAERAGAWTVRVAARRRIPASGVVWSEGGVVVTADHVLEQEDEVIVGLPDGNEVAAQVVGRDPGSELAVLRVPGATLTPAIRAGASARVGNLVLALGRPGAAVQASFGVVSAIGGPWRTRRGRQIDGFVRSDATFFPGFSGGPLINAAGHLLGINTSRFGPGQGITIPTAAAEGVVVALLASGRIRRAYLGVGSQPVALPAALAAKVGGQEAGLLIVSLEAGTPADQAGLLMGDILILMEGHPLTDAADLQSQLGPERVGAEVAIGVLRGGEPREIAVTLGERA
ncbi:MAG: PDZ domain-containing protein [Dehalococcoidia bacterium]|nr:PDZ domain-containing protein [Dehalococcoidia bacterium]